MKPDFRRSMIWLHTYSGLLTGWLLFVVFVTGTLSYYNQEISHWMKSSAHTGTHSQPELIDHGLRWLHQHAPEASRWSIQLPDDRGTPFRLDYRQDKQRHSAYLNPQTLAPYTPVESQGGNFFRTFHYSLSLRGWGGRYYTGIAAMAMLIAIFSGIYTHRRFFQDFFTLRRDTWQKMLKDLHALVGILTLPFCFVICFSALLIYISLYIPFSIDHHFNSYRKLNAEVSTSYPKLALSGTSQAPLRTIHNHWPEVTEHWPGTHPVSRVDIQAPSDSHARVTFTRRSQVSLSNKPDTLAFDHQGQRLDMPEERLARQIRRVFYGLHEAHFAKPGLRAMLFVLGALASALIATGMIIWLQKRTEKARSIHPGHQLVEKLNLAVLLGLPLAIGAYFLANRLLPPDIPARADAEIQALFWVWLSAGLIALIVKAKHAKTLLLALNTLAYLSVVGIDLLWGQATSAAMTVDGLYLFILGLITLTGLCFGYASVRGRQPC